MQAVDFSSWIAGWTALAFVVAFGLFLVLNARRAHQSRDRIEHRVLVTGTRGKSGTVRLIHAALANNNVSAFGKITGTAASELFTDGTEHPTLRLGPATACEMNSSLVRAAKQDAQVGVFECMAVSPSLIELVSAQLVQPEIVVIPTIRLDHLEEEGNSEVDIGRTILTATKGARAVVTGVTQPDIVAEFTDIAAENGMDIHFVTPDASTPTVPGHHPTNVAIAVKVCALLGLDEAAAVTGMHEVSVEPRAQTFDRIMRADGSEILLIDLSAANDPQSARDARAGLGLKREHIAPIIVNRWERPLRSLTFIAATYGRFGTVGVAGTLTHWANRWVKREDRRLKGHGAHTRYVSLPRRATRSADALWEWTNLFSSVRNRASRAVVLFENVHNPSADSLRKLFDREATKIDYDELRTKHG